MKIHHQSTRAFTFIELLVVVTIIAILSAIGLVSFTNANRNARDAKRKADLESIRQALVLYRSDNGCYPTGTGDESIDAIKTILLDGYISSPFPVDPQSAQGKKYLYDTSNATAVTCEDGTTSGMSGFSLSTTLEKDGGTAYTIANP